MQLRKKEAAEREQEEQMAERQRAKDPSERAQPATSAPPSAAQSAEYHSCRLFPGHHVPTRDEPEENVESRSKVAGFVTAQLFTMSHHIEKAQYAAVERGTDTFTLLSYTKTYAAMEYTPRILPGQEGRWLQMVATILGQVLGFAAPPKPAQIKDPRAEHRAYRNWRLKAPTMALEMGVSTNPGPPQHFSCKAKSGWCGTPQSM